MKLKNKIPLGILIITILVIAGISIFYFNTREEEKNVSNNITENKEERIEKEERTKDDLEKKETDIKKNEANKKKETETSKTQNSSSTSTKSNSNTNTNSNTGSTKSTTGTKKSTTSSKSSQSSTNNSSANKKPASTNKGSSSSTTQKQENTPQVDPEYERLKKLYKYPTGAACDAAAIKASMIVYDENYQNAGCVSGAYKGELVGYRIIIYYKDGTSMYYDGAVD